MLQQVLERRNEVLCVLTQKIVTTQKCVISEHVQIEEKCGGVVGIHTKIVQVCMAGARKPRPQHQCCPGCGDFRLGSFRMVPSLARSLSLL